ncbi:MAG: c-type cytochrome [Burkholderiaceae bacterium]|jgi:cytochrome c|nr:c-type cytochrome [Burkholderiaceae bacterium]
MSSSLKFRLAAAVLAVAGAATAAAALAQTTRPAAAPTSAAAKAANMPQSARFNLGREAKPEEIAVWDTDVRPDGHGLKKGRGSVARGQEIYDAQCALCHGTFGESNAYLALAGGVEPEDLKTGRASRLRDPDVQRTLGNKLNSAVTLYDYIYRAMPWTNPMSLSIDDTYAVTAYVLHLNDILPADGFLDEKTILTVPMPNRNGMTRNHGMGSVAAKPDVQGTLCMTNCVAEVKIASELPEFARNSHGNLRDQFRLIGKGAVDTSRYEPKPGSALAGVVTPAPAAAPVQTATVAPVVSGNVTGARASQLLAKNACGTCHHATNRVIGPSFSEIAAKHGQRSDGEAYLVKKMKEGGSGAWGAIPMPPQPTLAESDARELARWLMTGAKQ